MRALVDRAGAKAVFAKAGLAAGQRRRSQRGVSLVDVLGAHAYGATVVLGAAAPFGDIDAGRFKSLVARARADGVKEMRLAPWRSFFMIGLAPRAAASFVMASSKLGFVLHARDPRLRVVACPGAPACVHAHRALREDATRWVALLPKGEGVILHVSGCAKGCARPFAAAATLIATDDGYDLVAAGKASDPPARRGLTIGAIDALLANEARRLFDGERPHV